jgi:DNA-binding response OmpR family regulator
MISNSFSRPFLSSSSVGARAEAVRRVALVVEDEPLLRERIRAWLDSEKFDVVCASEYSSALAAMESCTPEIACVDLTLPRESGLELVEAIRKHTQGARLPIVVMSDRHSPEDMADAEAAGANAFLKKPFARPLLLRYVRWMLEAGPHESTMSIRDLQSFDLAR